MKPSYSTVMNVDLNASYETAQAGESPYEKENICKNICKKVLKATPTES